MKQNKSQAIFVYVQVDVASIISVCLPWLRLSSKYTMCRGKDDPEVI